MPVLARIRRFWVWWALGVETVLSTVLCSWSIGSKSVWFDEGASLRYAGGSLSQLWHAEWAHEANMFLYYLTLHFWMHLGNTEIELRVLSLIFAVGTVIATFLLARRIFGDLPAVAAGLIITTAPLAIGFAQTARSYTMAMFFVALSSHLLLRAIDRPTIARLALYVASIVAAMYSHDFGFFVFVAQVAWLVTRRQRPAPIRRFIVAIASIAVLLVPQAAFVIHTRGFVVDWIPPLSLYRIKETGYSLAGGQVLATALAGVIVAGAAVFLYRRTREGLRPLVDWLRTGEGSLVVLWLIVPVVITLVISLVKPLLVASYLIVCLPALAVACGRSIELALALPARGVVVVGLAALGIVQCTILYREPSHGNWREAAAQIAAHHPRLIIEYPYPLDALNYYLQRDGVAFRYLVPPSHDELAAAVSGAGPGTWFANLITIDQSHSARSERLLLEGLHARTSTAPTVFDGHGANNFAVTPLR